MRAYQWLKVPGHTKNGNSRSIWIIHNHFGIERVIVGEYNNRPDEFLFGDDIAAPYFLGELEITIKQYNELKNRSINRKAA